MAAIDDIHVYLEALKMMCRERIEQFDRSQDESQRCEVEVYQRTLENIDKGWPLSGHPLPLHHEVRLAARELVVEALLRVQQYLEGQFGDDPSTRMLDHARFMKQLSDEAMVL